MQIFLKHLREEHDLITEILTGTERYLLDLPLITEAQIPFLQELIFFTEHFIQAIHHKKEEELLFPKIDGSPIVHQGGPFCTHYYHFHLEYKRFEQTHELAQLLGIDLPPPSLTAGVQQIIEHHNALIIPLEDHWACQNYTVMFSHIVQALQEKKPLDPILLRRCIVGFTSLISQHTEKENNCLFVMANELLDVKTQEDLYQRALKEYPFDFKRIDSFREQLKR